MNFAAILLVPLPLLLTISAFSTPTPATPPPATERTEVSPPWWPDEHFVANGCFVSTSAYLHKLRERYPGVPTRAAHVRLPTGAHHTIAVVHWHNRNYGRDVFLGVFRIRGELQDSFDRAWAAWLSRGGQYGFKEPRVATLAERAQELELAAKILAFAHPTLIHVASKNGLVPLLWWLTPEGDLAVYEPTIGTAFGPQKYEPLLVAAALLRSRE